MVGDNPPKSQILVTADFVNGAGHDGTTQGTTERRAARERRKAREPRRARKERSSKGRNTPQHGGQTCVPAVSAALEW